MRTPVLGGHLQQWWISDGRRPSAVFRPGVPPEFIRSSTRNKPNETVALGAGRRKSSGNPNANSGSPGGQYRRSGCSTAVAAGPGPQSGNHPEMTPEFHAWCLGAHPAAV